MKLQISMDDDLLARVDECADKRYMTRSGFIAQACLQVVNQDEIVRAINRVSYAVMKAAENNEIDDETKKELEQFELMVKLMTGQAK